MSARISEFDKLALEELFDLRDRVEAIIDGRIATDKLELRKRLARIEQYERRKPASRAMPRSAARGMPAAPKYRDPVSGTTWSGRGKVPRWMKHLLEQGATRDDFLILGGTD
jgi:DNA-binding protein H-NS